MLKRVSTHRSGIFSGLFSALYGLAAYTAALATLLYLIGFTGNLVVPKSVDRGAGAPMIQALCIDLLLLALFGVQHSVMARRGFKQWLIRVVPAAVERSTYLVGTCASLGLLFLFWVPIDTPVIWQLKDGAGIVRSGGLIGGLFVLGWLLVVVSTYLIDHFELFGLRQAFGRLTGRTLPEAQFKTPLLYRYVRHPIYAGMLLAFWSTPVMTAGHLLFASGLGIYILIGIAFEERDLIRLFGERYRRYREDVGMLVPRLTRSPRTPRRQS